MNGEKIITNYKVKMDHLQAKTDWAVPENTFISMAVGKNFNTQQKFQNVKNKHTHTNKQTNKQTNKLHTHKPRVFR